MKTKEERIDEAFKEYAKKTKLLEEEYLQKITPFYKDHEKKRELFYEEFLKKRKQIEGEDTQWQQNLKL